MANKSDLNILLFVVKTRGSCSKILFQLLMIACAVASFPLKQHINAKTKVVIITDNHPKVLCFLLVSRDKANKGIPQKKKASCMNIPNTASRIAKDCRHIFKGFLLMRRNIPIATTYRM